MSRPFTIDLWTPEERHKAVKRCKTNYIYLRQIGNGIRVPSLELAAKLIRFDPRVTVEGLLFPKQRRLAKLARAKKTRRTRRTHTKEKRG